MQYKLLTISLLTLSTTGIFGQANDDDLQLNTITTSLPFLSITPESRGGAMGDAGTALSPNSTSIYWNTAMLNFSEDEGEVSVSYTPWLRQLTNDIHLSYLAGYKRIGDRQAIAGSLRYFSLGEITFTDNNAEILRVDKPSEFEIALGYAFKLSQKQSIGINGKYANSNLTKGLVVQGTETKAANAGMADISYVFRNDEARWGGYDGVYVFGATMNNIGNKVSYSETQRRDFLPMNLKLANAYTWNFDKYNQLTATVEFQKLLVPSPPIYTVNADGERVMAAGRDNNVGVVAGIMQSFYDAPGQLVKDEDGDYVINGDGTYQVEKGSRFKEEIAEINIATGIEYWYNSIFALRGGFFYEPVNKGNRKFLTTGIALQYNMFGIDISYLASLTRNSPLANTLRFTLRFKLGENRATDKSDAPE